MDPPPQQRISMECIRREMEYISWMIYKDLFKVNRMATPHRCVLLHLHCIEHISFFRTCYRLNIFLALLTRMVSALHLAASALDVRPSFASMQRNKNECQQLRERCGFFSFSRYWVSQDVPHQICTRLSLSNKSCPIYISYEIFLFPSRNRTRLTEMYQ